MLNKGKHQSGIANWSTAHVSCTVLYSIWHRLNGMSVEKYGNRCVLFNTTCQLRSLLGIFLVHSCHYHLSECYLKTGLSLELQCRHLNERWYDNNSCQGHQSERRPLLYIWKYIDEYIQNMVTRAIWRRLEQYNYYNKTKIKQCTHSMNIILFSYLHRRVTSWWIHCMITLLAH